jgi:hypothetical protein
MGLVQIKETGTDSVLRGHSEEAPPAGQEEESLSRSPVPCT